MKLVLLMGGMVAALGAIVMIVDPAAEATVPLTQQQERYCEAVDEWRMQELFDAPEFSRTGHPDHRNTYDEWCR